MRLRNRIGVLWIAETNSRQLGPAEEVQNCLVESAELISQVLAQANSARGTVAHFLRGRRWKSAGGDPPPASTSVLEIVIESVHEDAAVHDQGGAVHEVGVWRD